MGRIVRAKICHCETAKSEEGQDNVKHKKYLLVKSYRAQNLIFAAVKPLS